MKSIIGKNFKLKSLSVKEINEFEFRVRTRARARKQKNAKTIARFLEKKRAIKIISLT